MDFTDADPCGGCTAQCSDHEQLPGYIQSKIEEGPMSGSVKPYGVHILVCSSFGRDSTGRIWPERLESDGVLYSNTTTFESSLMNLAAEVAPLVGVKVIASACDRVPIGTFKRYKDGADHRPVAETEVVVLPDLASFSFTHDSTTPDEAVAVLSAYLTATKSGAVVRDTVFGPRLVEPSGRWGEADSPPENEPHVLRDFKAPRIYGKQDVGQLFPAWVIPDLLDDTATSGAVVKGLVLVCTHKKRDKRCGVAGPMLVRQFSKEIETLGVRGSVLVYGVSHFGGHKFAGNVIAYPEGVWYGRVKTCHAKPILETTMLGSQIFREIWRGNVDPSAKDLAQTRKQVYSW
ncbi:Sucraseferredoxin-like protein [Cladochytrium replicatum]|nr:Sucraseferredoxin-like protein [Cladochytrium replicatum]